MVRLVTFFKGVFSGVVLGAGMYFLFVATAEASARQPNFMDAGSIHSSAYRAHSVW
jgi:hypothetical protein